MRRVRASHGDRRVLDGVCIYPKNLQVSLIPLFLSTFSYPAKTNEMVSAVKID
jgi:hypothetical protein